MTPEGRVKNAIKKVLDQHKSGVWYFMPVQSGYGRKTVDFLITAYGHFIGIEAKAPGKGPTALQWAELKKIELAGGSTFVINETWQAKELAEFLEQCRNDPRTSQRSAQASWGA